MSDEITLGVQLLNLCIHAPKAQINPGEFVSPRMVP